MQTNWNGPINDEMHFMIHEINLISSHEKNVQRNLEYAIK